ncbi:MAG TPA: hypothetical protein VKB26_14880, partial [Candidatus Acidoferrales bacterium]|nr:hypothetical protein [Candidatus Acidoferrales bacterium]
MRRKKERMQSDSQTPNDFLTRRQFVRNGALLAGALPVSSLFGRAGFDTLLQSSDSAQDSPQATIQGSKISLVNESITAEWNISSTGLQLMQIQDRRNNQAIDGPAPVFSLTFANGSQIISSAMRIVVHPQIEILSAQPRAARYSERVSGRSVSATFEDAQHGLRAQWRAILRENSHYIRQEIEFSAMKDRLPITEVVMLDLAVADAEVSGAVKGSPVTSGAWFFGFEHPLSESSATNGRLRCTLARQLPLEHDRSASYSSVVGVTATGQLRRDFLRYIERERAHPYRTFLHYN